ncbi:MAG: DNA-3-methyladenine glycosylase 2 family protein [Roseobacter sp.]
MSKGRIISCDADVAEGAAWLADHCPHMADALQQTGPLPLRRRPDGFAQLLNAIISQQVSVASAQAIWGKLEAADMTNIANVSAASWDDLRNLGLSRQKIRYAQALANAEIDYAAVREMSDGDVVARLVTVPGIGAWTAEIYSMFSLGRADVFAPGDLALQEAVRSLYDLDKRPSEKDLRRRALDWSPWRSVAARLLFAYYRVIKQREGIT